MAGASRRFKAAAAVSIAVCFAFALAVTPPASAASQTDFSNAQEAIALAYSATVGAASNGGNVTALVARLQSSLILVENATAVNTSDPALASAYLQNATLIANGVSAQALLVGQAGLNARQAQTLESVGSAAGIVVVASLLYLFGDRIYRALWLRLYGGHLVRKVG
jgi:hypothetical protein